MRSRGPDRRRGTIARLLSGWALACSAAVAIGACGTATSAGDSPPTTTTTSTANVPFPNARGPVTTCSASQLASRESPIIYRPSWLGPGRKVPLLIALHGADGNPQAMEGVSHFEQLANEHGFVAAFLASCDLNHPWAAPQDLTYVSSMIDQITAQQNTDPSRVYISGFSAGGYETWLAGCRLSNKVAAIAIVAGAMNGRLYESCTLSRPVSELLVVGTGDGTRWTGVPLRLPSPYQTTAHWRALDGCSAQPVRTQQVTVATQETWSSCSDGSAVGLYIIPGAGHVWPPWSSGSPQYPTSEEIWTFLSAHRASPRSLSSADAKLLSLHAAVALGARTIVAATFRIGEPLAIVATLGPHAARPLSKTIRVRQRGQRVATFAWSFPVGVLAGAYQLVALNLRDSYGRTRRIIRSLKG